MKRSSVLERESVDYPFTPAEWYDMTSRALSLITRYPHKREVETVSDWMQSKMILTDGQSVYPGRFSFDVTPFMREIADNLGPRSGVTETVLIKGNQVAGSTVSFGFIGYCMDHGIGPALFVSGDQKMAEDTMEKRIAAIIDAAGLQDKIRPVVKTRHDKSTGQRRDVISYAGTFIRAVGPRSEAKLRSFPSRINLIEELDVFPQNLAGRGNPVEKVVRRADTFGPLRRIYYNSTPKLKHSSQIEPLYGAGDKRLYNVPCPKCHTLQPLTWAGMKWEKRKDGSPAVDIDAKTGQVLHDPSYYECAVEGCKAHWKNSDKFLFLRDAKAGGTAEWIPTKKPDRPGIRSYKLPSLYSPFRSWLDIVLQWWRVKDDALLLPDFVNDVLAETWEETIAAPQPHFLQARAEDWECGYIPAGVLFITLAADIQADRIEVMLVGWGMNKESWALNYWTFPGTAEEAGAECWKKLEAVIDTDYMRSDGYNLGHPIVAFVDAGYLQGQVNAFCDGFNYSPRGVEGVYPVIGKENQAEIYRAHKNDIETPLITLHDQRLKRELYSYLKREAPVKGAAFSYGYVHFPRTYDKSWYEQLTAEDIFIDTDKRGRKIYKIENRKQRRNEVLDCYKMNFGALHFMCLRWYEITNKVRKANGRKPLEIDWAAFWASWTQEKAA